MKDYKIRTALLFIVFCFVTYTGLSQNTLRVGNMPGSNAPYNNIQSAVDAAAAGDIIVVEGSTTDYPSNINITKKVTIQGPGYFLTENTGFQFNSNMATVSYYGSFTFSPGSEGSAMYGMNPYSLAINAANITIANCYMVGGCQINDGSNDAYINGNYILGGIAVTGNVPFFLVSNNYTAIIENINGANAGIFTNNIIFGGYTEIANCTVSNNIFLDSGSPQTITNCVISNNTFAKAMSAVPGADATNYFGIGYGDLFVGTSGHTTDTQFMLKPGSVAIGGGTGGVDIGIYGGNTPHYRPSGIRPGQPTITNFSSPGTVPQNGTLNLKVSAKVN